MTARLRAGRLDRSCLMLRIERFAIILHGVCPTHTTGRLKMSQVFLPYMVCQHGERFCQVSLPGGRLIHLGEVSVLWRLFLCCLLLFSWLAFVAFVAFVAFCGLWLWLSASSASPGTPPAPPAFGSLAFGLVASWLLRWLLGFWNRLEHLV